MGTTWRVRLAGAPDMPLSALRIAVEARLDRLIAEMSQWQPNSLLSRFNRSPTGTWTVLPPDFATVVDRALHIATATDGAFDPTMGRLTDLWGFGPIAVTQPPDDVAIAAACAASGRRRLVWSPDQHCLRQAGGLSLDLAGIAKGHAVDAIADLLAAAGIADALVEIGGELVGRGVRPDGQPWWVDLELPPGVVLPPLRVALHGLAVATSGDYRRGRHTLDPRTGRPTDNGVRAVSVIAPTALAADAWATALTVLGPAGMRLADHAGLAVRMVTGDADDAREFLSAPLEAMIAA